MPEPCHLQVSRCQRPGSACCLMVLEQPRTVKCGQEQEYGGGVHKEEEKMTE